VVSVLTKTERLDNQQCACEQRNKMLIRKLRGHTDFVTSVAFSHDGNRIVSGGLDKNIILWDAHTYEPQDTLQGHRQGIVSVGFNRDSNYLVSRSLDDHLKIWNFSASSYAELRVRGRVHIMFSAAFSPDGKVLAIACFEDTIILCNVQTGDPLLELSGGSEGYADVFCLAWSPDSAQIASGGGIYEGVMRIWDASKGTPVIGPWIGHSATVSCLSFDPLARFLVSGSHDRTVRIWALRDGAAKVRHVLRGHKEQVNSVGVSPDSKVVVSGSNDGTIRMWDVRCGEVIRVLGAHAAAVTSTVWSPAGSRVVSASFDRTVCVWRAYDEVIMLCLSALAHCMLVNACVCSMFCAFYAWGHSFRSQGPSLCVCLLCVLPLCSNFP
jgi:WD40 repeat protein